MLKQFQQCERYVGPSEGTSVLLEVETRGGSVAKGVPRKERGTETGGGVKFEFS